MCLQTNWTKPKVVEKDIIVYKILGYYPKRKKYKYLSPYRCFKYEFEKLYTIKVLMEKEKL